MNLASRITAMPNFIRLYNKPYYWLINETHQKLVQTHFVGKEELLAEESGKSPLKDNNARTIFTYCLKGQSELFVKRYKIDSFLRRLRHLVDSKAVNELKISNYLVTKGRLTGYPIAVVQKKHRFLPVDAFLIMKKLPDMPTMGGYLAQPLDRDTINEILQLSGELVRDLHDVKLFHRDLHAGNILIKSDSEPKELYIIDLHRASILPGVSRSQRVFNLAQFAYSLWGLVPFTNIVRLIKAYRPLDQRRNKFKSLVRDVYDTLLTIRHKHWQARTKRCFRSSSRHMTVKDGAKTHYLNRSFSGLAEPIISMLSNDNLIGTVLKETARHKLIRTQPTGGASYTNTFYIKEYRHNTLMSKIKSLFGYWPARNNWLAANGLAVRGIPTAQAVALMVRKEPFWDWVTTAKVMTAEINGTPSNQYVMDTFASPYATIHNKAPKNAEDPIAPQEKNFAHFAAKKEFIRDFALAIRRLHHKGVFHCDLKTNNVLVKEISGLTNSTQQNPLNPRFPNWEFYFIDLDRVKFRRVVPWRERIKNLAQLNAAMPAVMTRSDRLRFFRYYACGELAIKTNKERRILAEVMRITITRHHIWPR
ncbi:MAG: lipopolysaccharide kinase InaA family protein [Candidatus Paceibacterota bacterium]